MSLREIRENQQIVRRMKEAARTQVVSHAYILEGDGSVDKRRLALEFVKAVLCGNRQSDGSSCDCCISCQRIDHGNHEDVFFVSAEKNSIKDETIEEVQRRLANRPNQGNRNVVIVERADTMTVRAQNRLLKTLEEPAPGTMILLLSENAEHLLPTVRSRCVLYRLYSHGAEIAENVRLAAAQTGEQWLNCEPFYRLVKSAETALSDRGMALEFLDALELWLRDCLISLYDRGGELSSNRWPQTAPQLKSIAGRCGKAEICKAVDAVEETRQDIQHNINTAYALKGMFLR